MKNLNRMLSLVLVGLYLLRIVFRFLSNYLAHKAAWYLVGDLRTRTYDKLEHMHMGYFHDKQTGDLVMDHSTDHIFTLPSSPRHEFAVIDSGLRRAVAIASSGNDRVVVWNPGTEYTLPDFDEDSWRRFVCVGPVSDWPDGRTLEPGGKYVLAAAIQSTMETTDETAQAQS